MSIFEGYPKGFGKEIEPIPEGFKQITGYTQYYINKEGKVIRSWWGFKGYRQKEIKGYSCLGYRKVGLTQNSIKKDLLLHRLIAKEFIPNDDPEHKIFIDHKNGVKDDNSLSNLKWVTHAENMYNVKLKGCISPIKNKFNGNIYGYIATVCLLDKSKKQKYFPKYEDADIWRKNNLIQRQG
tara:strand:- start:1038 stop:1580 length:543 start_codon:yes stop_codon:yes gene_type:complete